MHGDATPPPIFSIKGFGYARWLSHNKKHVEDSKHQFNMAGGTEPVRGEKSFSRSTMRGFSGPWSGQAAVVSGPQEWQTTTNLGAGFNPNVAGAPAPAIGTPLGVHPITGAEICCDPLSWFREGIISNPSCFVLSVPGKGKSTLVRKMLMGDVAQGHIPIIAGDIKGEYVGFVQQVGGQVITIGHGAGTLNPLDVGALGRVIPQIRNKLTEMDKTKDKEEYKRIEDTLHRALEQVHGRQVTMVATLVGLGRKTPMKDWEAMLVSIALREIYTHTNIDWEHPPVLEDLINHLEQGSSATLDELWQVLAAAPGMVQHVDALTRLNRTDATVLNMITHTFRDLEALSNEEDRQTAMGFIERAGMVICGGLPASELDILQSRLTFTAAEAAMVVSWSRGVHPGRTRSRNARSGALGRGQFMIKPAKDGTPGIPVQTILTPTEVKHRLHDTNVRFDEYFSKGIL